MVPHIVSLDDIGSEPSQFLTNHLESGAIVNRVIGSKTLIITIPKRSHPNPFPDLFSDFRALGGASHDTNLTTSLGQTSRDDPCTDLRSSQVMRWKSIGQNEDFQRNTSSVIR
jgi:hypothetical protein